MKRLLAVVIVLMGWVSGAISITNFTNYQVINGTNIFRGEITVLNQYYSNSFWTNGVLMEEINTSSNVSALVHTNISLTWSAGSNQLKWVQTPFVTNVAAQTNTLILIAQNTAPAVAVTNCTNNHPIGRSGVLRGTNANSGVASPSRTVTYSITNVYGVVKQSGTVNVTNNGWAITLSGGSWASGQSYYVNLLGSNYFYGTTATAQFSIPLASLALVTNGITNKLQGSTRVANELPQFASYTKRIAVGKTEITWELFTEVLDYATNAGYRMNHYGSKGGDRAGSGTHSIDEPVTAIDWYDAVVWCNALSEYKGLSPVYRLAAGGAIYKTNISAKSNITFAMIWDAGSTNGYRLPFEAEFERAFNDAKQTKFYTGELFNNNLCWHEGNSGSSTKQVATKLSNSTAIFDLMGNVWEWCFDWYGAYPSGGQIDYSGASSGSYRVARGGSSAEPAASQTSTYRYQVLPATYKWNIGMRVVRTLN